MIFQIGYPVHAGIDHDRICSRTTVCRLPRTRGDRPIICPYGYASRTATPYTRGSTSAHLPAGSPQQGYPVHAGIDLIVQPRSPQLYGLPRTRGDRPALGTFEAMEDAATPYTRGSTAVTSILYASEMGYPVHAGIDRRAVFNARLIFWLPRTRGDRPHRVALSYLFGWATPYTRGSTLYRQCPVWT